MLPLVAVLLAGAGAAPLRAASPALRAAARRDVAAFLDGQPAGASVEALVAAFAARRAAREPDRAAGVHALTRALLKRRLFDVRAMADAADASVLDGDCSCPLTADECAETTVYNNTLLHRPSDGSPMELYYRETQPLDAMLAGDANCQELQGFEVCDDSPDCVPSTASLIYDCDAAAATMLGVAQVRSAELDNDDAEVYAALADRTGGAVTGDDDMFYGLSSQTVYVYTLLELQGQVTCSDGCNFYDACKTSCGGLAAEGADQSLDLDTSCTGQDKSDSTSLQRECSARARSGKSIHASRPFREMIARPKISRNEWKPAELGAFEVGNFALLSRPGRRLPEAAHLRVRAAREPVHGGGGGRPPGRAAGGPGPGAPEEPPPGPARPLRGVALLDRRERAEPRAAPAREVPRRGQRPLRQARDADEQPRGRQPDALPRAQEPGVDT